MGTLYTVERLAFYTGLSFRNSKFEELFLILTTNVSDNKVL